MIPHHHSVSTEVTKQATQPGRSKNVVSKNNPALSSFSGALSKVTKAAEMASTTHATKQATQTNHFKNVATTATKSASHTTTHTRSHGT